MVKEKCYILKKNLTLFFLTFLVITGLQTFSEEAALIPNFSAEFNIAQGTHSDTELPFEN